jgi:hypothetical protein
VKRILLLAALASIFGIRIFGQAAVNPIKVVPTDPSGACPPARVALSMSSGNYFYCDPMTMMWAQLAGSSAAGTVTSLTATPGGYSVTYHNHWGYLRAHRSCRTSVGHG